MHLNFSNLTVIKDKLKTKSTLKCTLQVYRKKDSDQKIPGKKICKNSVDSRFQVELEEDKGSSI